MKKLMFLAMLYLLSIKVHSHSCVFGYWASMPGIKVAENFVQTEDSLNRIMVNSNRGAGKENSPGVKDEIINEDKEISLSGSDLNIQVDTTSNIFIDGSGVRIEYNGSTGQVSIGSDSIKLICTKESITLASTKAGGQINHISLFEDAISAINGKSNNGLYVDSNQTVLRGSGEASSSLTLNAGLWSSNGVRPSGKINFTETIAIRQVDTLTGPNNNSRQIAWLTFKRGPSMADERGWLGRVFHNNLDLSDGDTVLFNEFLMDTASISFSVDGINPPKPFQEVAPTEIFKVDRIGMKLSQPLTGKASIKTTDLELSSIYEFELQPHTRTVDPYIELSPGFVQQTGGGYLNVDFMDGRTHEKTLDAHAVLSASNLEPGQQYSLFIKQNGNGGFSAIFDDNFKWIGGAAPTVTPDALAVDLFEFRSDGVNLYEISRSQDLK